METISLDANILILLTRNQKFENYFVEKYLAKENEFILCFAAEAEPLSFSFRRAWGRGKKAVLSGFIRKLKQIREVSDEMMEAYVEIDAYTLCQHPTLKKPQGETAHRMGKNDLWIAATTYVHADRIVTTDQDFIQLDGVFFPVDYIDISEFTGR